MEKVWKKRFGKFVKNVVENQVSKLCENKGGQIVQNIWWTNWVEKFDCKIGLKVK